MKHTATRTLLLRSFDLPDAAVATMRGRERIGAPFELEVTFTLERTRPLSADEVDAALGAPAVLAFVDEESSYDPWHGMLREIELLASPDTRHARYRAVMVPRLWRASLTRRSRFFRDLSVPDIVSTVLRQTGMEPETHFELRLYESYSPREYTVQYEESDLDLVARLLEHEGISCFFVHDGSGERLVLTDANAGFVDALEGPARFDPRLGTTGSGVHELSWVRRLVPEHLVIRDHDASVPGVTLQEHAMVDPRGAGVQALFGEHWVERAHGQRLARVRADQLATDRSVVRARSTLPALRPGHRVTLEHAQGIAVDELEGQPLLVVAVAHDLEQLASDDTRAPRGYANELELVPLERAYRPPRRTPRPRAHGIVTAKVTGGTPSTHAPIDSQGRYQLVFPFDTEGAASRWVRLAEPYAGNLYGMHFPLHVGTEVIVAFLQGDPDRPVIVGAVPNPDTASPVTTDNATRSIVRTHNDILTEWEDDA